MRCRSCRPDALVACADGLSGVLDHGQAVALGESKNGRHLSRVAIEVYRHNGAGALGNRGLNLANIEVESLGIDIDEDRARAGHQHAIAGGDKAEGCGDHLVIGADAVGEQRQEECGGTVADRDGVAGLAEFGEGRLQTRYLRALGKHARAEHGQNCLLLLRADQRARDRDHRAPPPTAWASNGKPGSLVRSSRLCSMRKPISTARAWQMVL